MTKYELFTNKSGRNEMPFHVYAKTRPKAISFAKSKMIKGEKIISLRRVR